MRVARIAASIAALCLVTGLIVYGGVFLWPGLADSNPILTDLGIKSENSNKVPKFLYSIGDNEGLIRPNEVVVDGKDRVYVTDAGTAKVFVFTLKGKKIAEFGGQGSGKSQFGYPNGLAVADDGNLVIADSVQRNIRVFSPDGKYLKTLLESNVRTGMVKPGSMTKGRDGNFYISDLLNNRVLKIEETGKTVKVFSDSGGPLSYPQGTAVDKKGRLWVADSGNYSVRIFDNKGNVTDKISGGGEPETSFSMVRGLEIDSSGRIYVSDTISHRIRVFDASGRQVSVFPELTEGEGSLVFPTGLFINDGKLFVVDRGASDIKVFSLE